MAFLGHGNPMNALEHNRYTDAWRAFGASVPAAPGRPRASRPTGTSHATRSPPWRTRAPSTTSSASPTSCSRSSTRPRARPTSPPRWPRWSSPPGSGSTSDSWGLDHGTWSVLVHAFPDADVPVDPALDRRCARPIDDHLALGAALAPLRDEGRADPRQRQRRAQPGTGRLAPPRGRRGLGRPLRRGRHRGHDVGPGGGRAAGRPPRLPDAPCPPRTTSSRCCTSPGGGGDGRDRRGPRRRSAPWGRCR